LRFSLAADGAVDLDVNVVVGDTYDTRTRADHGQVGFEGFEAIDGMASGTAVSGRRLHVEVVGSI
jgi:hypothetical protein